MASLGCLRISGSILAVIDLLFGLYILGFYSKIQYERQHCTWAHAARGCEFYIYASNHQTRTIVGIVSGGISVIFSIILLIAFIKRKPLLAWSWLLKSLGLIAINIYFLSDWLVKRGRHYHSYWDPNEYDEENFFIMQAAIELVVQLVFSVFFCFFNGYFTYKKQRYEGIRRHAESQI